MLTKTLTLAAAAGLAALSGVSAADSKKPNIIQILVDDQDAMQDSIESMDAVQRIFRDDGTKFSHFFCPVSLCCPSRVSWLRAQYAHNTNVTYVGPPGGGYGKFGELGMTKASLPVFLQEAGYATYYVGKYMNEQTADTVAKYPTLNYTGSDFLVDPQTYAYWNGSFLRDNGDVVYWPGIYSTDIVSQKGSDYLNEAAAQDKPFFLSIAPIGPHTNVDEIGAEGKRGALGFPLWAPRHDGLFNGTRLNTSRESFNPKEPSGASWVKNLDRLNETELLYIESFYQARLKSLQAVDELVDRIWTQMEALGIAEETYFIYTSDNGFESNGGHRRQPGKTLGYEEDIRIPFLIRGPGVKKGYTNSDSTYSLHDWAATIMHLAGAEASYEHDGSVMPILESDYDKYSKVHTVSEYWHDALSEGDYGRGYANSTYRTVRTNDGKNDIAYIHWCTGERELYNMKTDSDQMHNLLSDWEQSKCASNGLKNDEIERIANRHNALMLVLKTCVGDECGSPWKYIFPNGEASSYQDALSPRFDKYFESLPLMEYESCETGYHARNEKPTWSSAMGYAGQSSRIKLAM